MINLCGLVLLRGSVRHAATRAVESLVRPEVNDGPPYCKLEMPLLEGAEIVPLRVTLCA